jgi:hypothetical protein
LGALCDARELTHFAGENAMKDTQASGGHVLKSGGRFLGHTVAILVGLVLMIVGLGLGVTMVLLPIGLPLGLAGLLLCLWGFYFGGPSKQPKGTEEATR